MSALAAWRRMFVALPLVLVAALGLSMFSATSAEAHKSKRDRKIHHGLEVAINQKGDRYSYGSDGPGAFDCSGLTMYSFGKAGLYLPRSSDAQARFARHIPKKKLRRGDFVFFHSGRHVYHVAVYLGHHDGKRWILHAPHSGTVVQRDPIWTKSWSAGTLRHRP
jgi:cell wall-associated NlpC family hydrolase